MCGGFPLFQFLRYLPCRSVGINWTPYVPSAARANPSGTHPAADSSTNHSLIQPRPCINPSSEPSPPSLPEDMPAAADLPLLFNRFSAARCIPFSDRRARGPREPDAMAVAYNKRLFVKQTPYVVGELRCSASRIWFVILVVA